MQRFAQLYTTLDRTTATSAKVAAMAAYFAAAAPADAAWAVFVLTGRKLKRLLKANELHALAVQGSGCAEWLVGECYEQVGDLAETVNLLLDAPETSLLDEPLHAWMERHLPALATLTPEERSAQVARWLAALARDERFVLLKLLTGALRVGVSQRLVVQALAQVSGTETALVAHRLMGDWVPGAAAWSALVAHAEADVGQDRERPYPFFLASPLDGAPDALGARDDWLAEWKWDGIRAQLLLRDGVPRLWSRGEERLDGRFPEIETAARFLPRACVLDGEILAWRDAAPRPFADLQPRIGRLAPGAKLLADVPVAYLVYDLLELDGVDWRERPLAERRAQLSALLPAGDAWLRLSPEIGGADWPALHAERERAREVGVEGLMLKRRDSPYQVGRRRGDWWKWKVDPYTLDAVLIYAQPGSGRRSNLYTDYTFGVWDGDVLVPVAKAYSGLDNAEIERLDRWIRANTLERFGPVRAVKQEHVFELAFEAINRSKRHKSGVAVRFPRILRWRSDKPAREADTLATLLDMAT